MKDCLKQETQLSEDSDQMINWVKSEVLLLLWNKTLQLHGLLWNSSDISGPENLHFKCGISDWTAFFTNKKILTILQLYILYTRTNNCTDQEHKIRLNKLFYLFLVTLVKTQS